MIVDQNLERYPWAVVSGPSVNPIPPSSFEPVLTSAGLRIYIAGPAYSAALAKIVRPLPAVSTGHLLLSFDLIPDDGTVLFGQAREFDLRVTDAAGWTYPFDMQLNWQKGGMLQLATGVAASQIQWQDSGIQVGRPIAGQPIHLNIAMKYDTTAHICSVLNIQGSTVTANPAIPSALQNQPAFQAGWEPNSVVRQHQLCLDEQGGAMSDLIANDSLAYVGS